MCPDERGSKTRKKVDKRLGDTEDENGNLTLISLKKNKNTQTRLAACGGSHCVAFVAEL